MLLFLLSIGCSVHVGQKENDTSTPGAEDTSTAEETDTGAETDDTGETDTEENQDETDTEETDTDSEDTDAETDDTGETETEEETEPSGPLPLEIIGSYIDNLSTEHLITDESWLVDYGGLDQYYYMISQYSNESQYVIAENSPNNPPPEPGAWSRFDWTYDGNGHLWVCQTTFEARSESEALQTPAADASNPSQGGCDPYGWWRLTH